MAAQPIDTSGSHDSTEALQGSAPAAILTPLDVTGELTARMSMSSVRTVETTAMLLDQDWAKALEGWPQTDEAKRHEW